VTRALEIVRTGPLVTVQDLGRIGWAHLGVSRSGAADRAALRRAGRLVGNASGAAGLEVLVGGLEVRATGDLVVAVSGADCPLSLDGRAVPGESLLDLRAGSRLVLGTARHGLRAYLAVRGGVAVPPVLGSRSRDTLAALGPGPLRPGDVLPVGPTDGPDVAGPPTVDQLPVATPAPDEQPVVLRALVGPRADRLEPAAAERLWTQTWHVSPNSDRIGVRLDGAPLERAPGAPDLPSEPLVRGAVQLPPGGRPVVFLADHPVTGGYPVVAAVLDADTDLLGQLGPGRAVRFRRASAADLGLPPFRPDLRCPWWGW